MEKKIGERFEFRGIMLEVVESKAGDCMDCYGLGSGCLLLPECLQTSREDGKNVRFVHTAMNFNNYGLVPSITARTDNFQPNKHPQTFADAFDDLIEQAENLSRKAETPEQHSVCNEAVDRLIAMRARLSPVTAMTRAESYGTYIAKDSPSSVRNV